MSLRIRDALSEIDPAHPRRSRATRQRWRPSWMPWTARFGPVSRVSRTVGSSSSTPPGAISRPPMVSPRSPSSGRVRRRGPVRSPP
jgi:hypothetical protein